MCAFCLLLQAVQDDWYFQMYYDDLPVWGFIGKMEKLFKPGGVTEFKYFLFTHIDFDIKYNDDHVIEINVSTDPLVRWGHMLKALWSGHGTLLSSCMCWVLLHAA